MSTGFWLGSQNKRDHVEDLGLGGRIIIKWVLKMLQNRVDSFHLAKGRN
jgi:hypothetical protein